MADLDRQGAVGDDDQRTGLTGLGLHGSLCSVLKADRQSPVGPSIRL
jgi:hypothetical protein